MFSLGTARFTVLMFGQVNQTQDFSSVVYLYETQDFSSVVYLYQTQDFSSAVFKIGHKTHQTQDFSSIV